VTGPGPDDALTRAFEAHRPRLLRVAYATVGSVSEAEDCVQEAWLRLRAQDPASIRDLGAWLTTTVSRLAYDTLGSARARREGLADDDPADRVTLDESVSMALLVVLERLSPAERTAFLLHDVFGLAFEEVADVVGRTPAAVRQLAFRARRHVEDGRPRFPPTLAQQRRLVAAFADACGGGDMERLVALLAPGVVWRADGGGKVSAARPATPGAQNVARWLLALARRPPRSLRMAMVNGAPGLVMRDGDGVLTVIAFTIDAGRITALDVMRNPDKLTTVPDSC